MYNQETQQIAADVYHNYLDQAHVIIEDFNSSAHHDSINKMNILWGQLHMAGGARYMYGDEHMDEYSYQWLGKKGRKIIDELMKDAKKSNMKVALKNLKELRDILEEKNLIN